ncbi:MAG: hypothetical protein Q4G16_00440 [Cruoricaptor ignavus]|nr:hypothetical protein [Cruoricaptor ignavus]
MAQGNLDIAFEQPFYLKGRQYYTDAVAIQNPLEWLRTFTANQGSFQMHTNTHPPFVVLLHYYILEVFGGSILGLGVTLFLISSLFFLILNRILKNFDFQLQRRKEILLLSAIIPSVNIYLLVSIDGVILMTSSLVLLAVSRIHNKKSIDIVSFLYAFSSIILTNILSFSGLFLFAFIGIYALYFILKKEFSYLWFTTILFLWYILTFVVLYIVFGYNHLQTFLHASSSENPGGFMLLHNPYIYFWTRFQAVGEILMFLSLGITALFFSGKKYYIEMFSSSEANAIFLSSITALILMFLSGAYGTGETARACLFIVPFFLILFKEIKKETFHIVYFLCLFQTFGMQLIGNYFW